MLNVSPTSLKKCPNGQIRTKVCQMRCIKQETLLGKVAKKLQYNRTRSPRVSSSSSTIYYTAKQSPSESTPKKTRKASPLKKPLLPFANELQKRNFKLKKASPKKPTLTFVQELQNKFKLKKPSPKKPSPKKPTLTFLQEIQRGSAKLKPTKVLVRKSPQNKGFFENALLKKFENLRQSSTGSISSNNWDI